MKFRLAALALTAAVALPSILPGTARAADAFTPDQKKAIEGMIRNYLLANPELIEEVMVALEKKKADEAQQAQKAIISERSGILFNSSRQVVLGNPKGDVTVVEFFDYNCGYCKRALGDMLTLIKEDRNIRFVLKEFPVLGTGSKEAAEVAVAVNRLAPAKYIDFHQKLLGTRGEANRARAIEAAVSVGIDKTKLEAELGHAEIGATLEETYALANGLGLTGTPSYVVGEAVVPGAIGYERLKQRIADARNCGSTTC